MHGEAARGLRLVGHSDLGGYGDGMQVMRHDDALYVGHFGPSGMGTSILDVGDVTMPTVVRQFEAPEGSHTHKVQVADGLLLTNHEAFRGGRPERTGMAVHDLSDPFEPRQIGFWDSTGLGVHRIVWEGGRYAYVSATPQGFSTRIWVVIDLEDPEHPEERARWWWPGMEDGGSREWPEAEERSVHHALIAGDRAFLGLWDSGMVILDISDLDHIEVISTLNWVVGGHTHTCLPLVSRGLVAVTDEVTFNDCQGPPHMIRLVDITEETEPVVRAVCPTPGEEFCLRGLRYGAHCLHENRPNSYRSDALLFATYFNAGIRVFEIDDPNHPQEIAHYIPACPTGQEAIQVNDVFVDESFFVYITDRVNGGVYILEPEDELATIMTANQLIERNIK
ncbi:MAG TPA: hypothetical protein VFP42_01810 [Acidimicrobiia bacterium]|nr:hypothetical protein [Acidimicrobiia bacterium]